MKDQFCIEVRETHGRREPPEPSMTVSEAKDLINKSWWAGFQEGIGVVVFSEVMLGFIIGVCMLAKFTK